MQTIKHSLDKPLIIDFTEYGSDIIKQISIEKSPSIKFLKQPNLKMLYPHGRKISKNKYEDLIELLEFVPNEFHDFYKKIKYTDNVNDD